MTAPEDDTTDAIDVTSRALLIAYDPRSGRRPDIQRLGPILRGVGLADLLETGAVADQGDSVQALGDAPASPPMLTLWTDCRNGTSWNAAVSRNGRIESWAAEDPPSQGARHRHPGHNRRITPRARLGRSDPPSGTTASGDGRGLTASEPSATMASSRGSTY